MNSSDNELALRAHIRELLLEYAYTHLTTDYVQYSENLMSNLLAKILKPIPTYSPGELAFPVDPFETLKKKLKFDELKPYEEVWQPTAEALQLLKETFLPPKSRPRTDGVWEEDDGFDYDAMPYRPMSPAVLSRSSRKKTPLLGKKKSKCTDGLAAQLTSHGVKNAPEEMLPTREPAKLEECLDLKLVVDAATHADMLELQRQNPFLGRPAATRSLQKYAADFLRSESPNYEEHFRPISPPVFPRGQRARPKTETTRTILGPIKPVPVEVPDVEMDIATESMKIIDGWMTLPSDISTPSLSPGTSEVDELEEDSDLWRPSSSAAEPSAAELTEASKMEEPLFPRTHRPRAGKPDPTGKKAKQSLLGVISAHLPTKSSVRIRTEPSSDDGLLKRAESPAPSLSMLGQPPSESDASSTKPMSEAGGESLDKDIRRVLKMHGATKGATSYHDIIMDEQLDEKQAMFMEVPKLPAPNEYLEKAAKQSATTERPPVSLHRAGENGMIPKITLPTTCKKVTGLKSLNLELSWRPFSFGSRIPTHEELIYADSLFSPASDSADATDQKAVEKLLAEVANFARDAPGDTRELKISSKELHIHDPRILNDIRSDDIFDKLDPRFDPNRDFYEDTLLLSRFDRYGLSLRPPITQSIQSALTHGDSPSKVEPGYETSDFSSAITPEFDNYFPLAQNADDAANFDIHLPYVPEDQVFHREYDVASDTYSAYDCLDILRGKKKRRLTSPELDALCAMETTIHTLPATVNPKDLMVPQDNFDVGTYDHHLAVPASYPALNSGTTFAASQSLSLSIHEDTQSQECDLAIFCNTRLGNAGNEDEIPERQRKAVHLSDGANIVAPPAELGSSLKKPAVVTRPDPESQQSFDHLGKVNSNRLADMNQSGPALSGIGSSRHLDVAGTLHGPASEGGRDFSGIQQRFHSAPLSLLSDRNNLSWLLQLRGRQPLLAVEQTTSRIDVSSREEVTSDGTNNKAGPEKPLEPVHYSAPAGLLAETRALTAPEPWQPPTIEHVYLVSVDFMHQRALLHALESLCAVRLAEREVISPLSPYLASAEGIPQAHSADISIIVGPHSGVVFFPLSTLPSQNAYKMLLDSLAGYSWRFSGILLILIAFPRSQLVRLPDAKRGTRDGPSSYSPPALKAARRVRRDLALREGTGEKSASCKLDLAFADSVEQAAMFVRSYGDLGLRDSLVDYTRYIGEEEEEGEHDLAELEGMNAFCAAAILRCCTLEEFLEMPPEQRSEGLADIIGDERIEGVNAILKERAKVMETDLPSSPEFLSSNG